MKCYSRDESYCKCLCEGQTNQVNQPTDRHDLLSGCEFSSKKDGGDEVVESEKEKTLVISVTLIHVISQPQVFAL